MTDSRPIPARPAPILASFHYFRRVNMVELVGSDAIDLFADSGAFSAHNTGAAVTLPDYCAWLADNHRAINFAAALDVIGNPKASRANADALRSAVGDRVAIVPTFHVGSPWPDLHGIASDYPFLALGGAVGVNGRETALLAWLAKAHKILADHGAVAHGFGLTRPPYPHALPWYSVDSSYWQSASRIGSISLWDGRGFAKFRVGTRAVLKHTTVIRSYGGDPAVMARPGFGIVREVGDRARQDRTWMGEASALSYWRYGESLRARWNVPSPPGVAGDGPKLYLAAGSRGDWRELVGYWHAHMTYVAAARRIPATHTTSPSFAKERA